MMLENFVWGETANPNFVHLDKCSNRVGEPEFSETLGLGLEIQDLGCQDRVLVLVLTEILNQDQSWYWSHLKFCLKTSLGIGLKREKNQD